MKISASSSWWMRKASFPSGSVSRFMIRRSQISLVFHSVRIVVPGVPSVPKPPGPRFHPESS